MALLIGAVGHLLVELAEVRRIEPNHVQHTDTPTVHTAELVETENGWVVEVRGSAGARVLVLDRSGRRIEMSLGENGEAREFAGTLEESTVWIEGLELPAVPIPPTPVPPEQTPTPTVAPAPTPTPTPSVIPTRRPVRKTPTPTPVPIPSRTPVIQIKPTPAVSEPNPTPKPSPRTSASSPPILHLVSDAGPRIAITFDGGASSNRTAELLDLLQDLEIEATLFLTGGFIRAQPALVRRAVLSGHEVGNHTDSHLHLTSYASDRQHNTLPDVSRERLLGELRRTEEAFQSATGRPMAPLWRAPYGEENPTLRRWAFEAGYLHVRWSSLEGRSLDTMDWIEDEHSPYFRDSRRIMDRLLRFPRLRGGIILMHLATDREEPPWTHLPEFVAALRDRSIEPAKVTTLLSESRIWKGWLEQAARRHVAATRNSRELIR